MKKIINHIDHSIWIMTLLIIFLISSCKKDESSAGKGAPVISKVRLVAKSDTTTGVVRRITLDTYDTITVVNQVPFDSTTTTGQLNRLYAIVGENLKTTKSITFNGKEVYFNPTLVTDNSVLVNTGEFIPYGPNQSNMLVLTTNYGTVSYNFSIQQPIANIESFAPLAAAEGEIVTIKGTIFENIVGVRFGDIPAEIVGTPTSTEIKVKVPAGVSQAFIFVETSGGIAKSASNFGFKLLVFDDELATGWRFTSYGGATSVTSAENIKRGTKSIKNFYPAGYSAFRINYNGATINVAQAGLTALKFSVFGGTGATGKRISLTINNNYNIKIQLTLTEGTYTDFTIPLSSLGNPTTITEIVLQEYSGFANSTIYIDDVGFI